MTHKQGTILHYVPFTHSHALTRTRTRARAQILSSKLSHVCVGRKSGMWERKNGMSARIRDVGERKNWRSARVKIRAVESKNQECGSARVGGQNDKSIKLASLVDNQGCEITRTRRQPIRKISENESSLRPHKTHNIHTTGESSLSPHQTQHPQSIIIHKNCKSLLSVSCSHHTNNKNKTRLHKHNT